MAFSVSLISLGNCQSIRCKDAGAVLPRFQYFYRNFLKQLLIIVRTFLSVLSPRYFIFVIFLSMLCTFYLIPLITYASTVTLAWDQNPESDLAGYNIHYGTSSRNYDYSVDTGNSPSCTISGLQEGTTYYFAVTAYDSQANESDFSEEIAYTMPMPPQPSASTISAPAIYVSDSSIDLLKKGPNYYAIAYVTVWDYLGTAVRDAIVSGQWFLNGKYINEVSDSSDRKGAAKLILNKVRAKSGDQLTLMITDVVKYGYSYDSSSNIADEISINFP